MVWVPPKVCGVYIYIKNVRVMHCLPVTKEPSFQLLTDDPDQRPFRTPAIVHNFLQLLFSLETVSIVVVSNDQKKAVRVSPTTQFPGQRTLQVTDSIMSYDS